MLQATLFILVLLAGIVSAFALNPALAFALYEAVYFFYPDNRWWGTMLPQISWSFYTVLIMGLVFLRSRSPGNDPKLSAAPQFRWLYFLVGLYAVTWFWSVLPEFHLDASIYFIKTAITISLAYKLIRDSKSLNYVIQAYVLSAFYLSFYIWQIGRNVGNRVEAVGTVDSPDANGLAATLAPSVVISFHYFFFQQRWYGKAFFALSTAFLANSIVLINSRGAFLGVAISMAVYLMFLYFAPMRRRYQRLAAVVVTLLGLVAAYEIVDDSFTERMQTIFVASELDNTRQTGSTRVFFWQAAWEMAKDHPLGAGYSGFKYYAPQYIPADVDTGRSVNRSVHSTWFETLSEVGYLGLGLFCMIFYSSFAATQKCKKVLLKAGEFESYHLVVAMQAALLGFMVTMTFLDRMRAEVLYWLFLYTACAYNLYVAGGNWVEEPRRVNSLV